MKNAKTIVMSGKVFPKSDPNTWLTAVIDGVPRYEFSRRDQQLWSRPYGAPLSEPFRPICYMSPDQYISMTHAEKREICRDDAAALDAMQCREEGGEE